MVKYHYFKERNTIGKVYKNMERSVYEIGNAKTTVIFPERNSNIATKGLRGILNADKITGDIVIIYDENVPGEFIRYYSKAFAPKAAISLGDNKKNTDAYLEIISGLSSLSFKKNDMLIAVGGGSTTDIAGFIACTYKRGIDFAIIPSTLLCAVDAGLGGKNGINTNDAKNLIGTFYQPKYVINDFAMLSGLDNELIHEATAELIKMALLGNDTLLNILANSVANDESIIFDNLSKIVKSATAQKMSIVCKDPYDKGERKFLNFGHTLGHAIESYSEYKISHGRAVAYGMIGACNLGLKLGITSRKFKQALLNLLQTHGFDTAFNFTYENLIDHMLLDKKRESQDISFVIPKDIHKFTIVNISPDELKDLL